MRVTGFLAVSLYSGFLMDAIYSGPCILTSEAAVQRPCNTSVCHMYPSCSIPNLGIKNETTRDLEMSTTLTWKQQQVG